MGKNKINCFNCVHFFVTWDSNFPRGCKAMDFKSRKMPSTIVYEASGMSCMRFKAKKNKSLK
jgi:hypothetical protein